MSDLENTPVDFVRELRLRQWARQHYVPLEARKATWHPVVLDEMVLRDRELAIEQRSVSIDEFSATQLEAQLEIQAELADELLIKREVDPRMVELCAKFVPLVPDTHFRLDEGCGDVPKPHAWARVSQSHYPTPFASSLSVD